MSSIGTFMHNTTVSKTTQQFAWAVLFTQHKNIKGIRKMDAGSEEREELLP